MENNSQWVFVKGGKHKGKTLRFVKRTDKRIGVEAESTSSASSPGKIIYILPDHVGTLRNVDMSMNTATSNHSKKTIISNEEEKSPTTSTWTTGTTVTNNTSIGTTRTWVKVTGGKHKGKTLRFVKRTAQRIAVALGDDGNETIVYLLPQHVENIHIETQDKLDDQMSTSEQPTSSCIEEVNTNTLVSNNNNVMVTPSPNGACRPVSPILSDGDDFVIIPKNITTNSSTWVEIIGGKHRGKTLQFVKRTAQRVAVALEDNTIIYLVPSNVKFKKPVFKSKSDQDPILMQSKLKSITEEEIVNTNALVSNDTSVSLSTPNPRTVSPTVSVRGNVPEDSKSTNGWMKITGGKHKGKILRFIKRTAQRVAVALEDDKIIYLTPDHVRSLEVAERPSEQPQHSDIVEETEAAHSRDLETTNMLMDDDEESYHDFMSAVGSLLDDCGGEKDDEMNENLECKYTSPLSIHGGKHRGKKAMVVKRTPKRIAVKLEGESKIRYLSPSSLDPTMSVSNITEEDENDPMVQAIRQQLPYNTARCIKNVTDVTLKRTLFGIIFGGDNPVFLDVQTASISKLPHTFVQQGQTFHLAAVKMHDKVKSLTCSYVPAPSREDVANRLLQIGSFDKLIPQKTGARLELLLSTVAQDEYIRPMNVSNFCYIPERGNVGCGFIPRKMIDLLMGEASPQVCALQVRIVIPSMGIFKGMLFEKQGIDKIELPSSMQKVNAAINPDRSAAWLMINKSGVYPYPTRIQQAENRFQEKKEIKEMARWMLTQKGVSKTYLNQPNGQHSNLVGVADPTDAIPSGCVFLTGIQNQLDTFGDRVVISRFPMTEASDGRVLPIVRSKPHTMSTDQWKFLCSKPFGIVVFGNPAPGSPSMPEQIAQGDLDGDGYFVTWDRTIVEDAVIGDRAIFPMKDRPTSLPLDWWSASQEFMTNIEKRKESQKVIGRLHDCWKRYLQQGLQQDSILFGRAFKSALVSVKHGGKIGLPVRLHSQIPRNMHHFLVPMAEDEL